MRGHSSGSLRRMALLLRHALSASQSPHHSFTNGRWLLSSHPRAVSAGLIVATSDRWQSRRRGRQDLDTDTVSPWHSVVTAPGPSTHVTRHLTKFRFACILTGGYSLCLYCICCYPCVATPEQAGQKSNPRGQPAALRRSLASSGLYCQCEETHSLHVCLVIFTKSPEENKAQCAEYQSQMLIVAGETGRAKGRGWGSERSKKPTPYVLV